MRARTRCAVVVVVAAMLSAPLFPGRAHAQSFNDAFMGAISGGCSPLPSVGLGSQLAAICSGGGGAASGGSSILVDNRNNEMAEQRLLRRLQERREQKRGASADDGMGVRGLSVFASADYQYAEKSFTTFEPAYERDGWGGTVGADYLLGGGKFLVGLALNYAHQHTIFSRHAGEVVTDAYGPTFYASYFPKDDVFLEGYAGYTYRDYGIERRFTFLMPGSPLIPAGVVNGETSSNEYKAGLNSGIDYHFGRFTVGPRLGLDFKENQVNGYAERGATGAEVAFDRQTQQSLTSKLGVFASMAISMGWGVLVPQSTLEWRHEFKDNQRTMFFHFVQDPAKTKFTFQSDPPDRDYFNGSLGVVALLRNGLIPFLNVRQLFGYNSQSSTTVTGGLRVSF